jgi:hypothetical protein
LAFSLEVLHNFEAPEITENAIAFDMTRSVRDSLGNYGEAFAWRIEPYCDSTPAACEQ